MERKKTSSRDVTQQRHAENVEAPVTSCAVAGASQCQARLDLPELLRATAWRTSALKADASTSSPAWMSIARRTFPSRLELKRRAGSFRDAPLAKVNFTMDLYVSPVQMIPSCDHVGVPGFVGFTHFNSSTTFGSAFLMSVRILLRVSPRQSPSSAILFEMSCDGDWPWLASDFFMFSPIS